jgi:hypothetical protein
VTKGPAAGGRGFGVTWTGISGAATQAGGGGGDAGGGAELGLIKLPESCATGAFGAARRTGRL